MKVAKAQQVLTPIQEVSTSTDAAALVDSQVLKVTAMVPESELVTSYWLAPADRAGLAVPVAGQFLPIAVDVPGHGVLRRSYTISAWEANRYRLSIKRERLAGLPPGRVSNHIHDHWTVGYRISAGTPQGGFVLDPVSMRPIVMLAGGIGVTPLLAMLRALATTFSIVSLRLRPRASGMVQKVHL